MRGIKYFLSAFVLITIISCNKYLDVKSSSGLVIPKTPEDLQALLDSYTKINYNGIATAEASADDYFINQTDYQGLTDNLRRIYTWESNNLFISEDNDWSFSYNKIYNANVVIDNIKNIDPNHFSQAVINDVKGQALYIRSFALFQLVTTFALAYNEGTADTDLGVPLRLTSELNEKIFRPTLEQTFEQIIKDLKEASSVMNNSPAHAFRASKPAAFGLLARVYLYMHDYDKSFSYADSCIRIKGNLISYNTPTIPNLDAKFPFSAATLLYNNPEIIFASRIAVPRLLNNTVAKIDTQLINLYKKGDNRKRVLFAAGTGVNSKYYNFKGSYDGSVSLFDGVATDEVYLMRSESLVRLNKVTEAMADLNLLLSKRWDKTIPYVNLSAANQAEALNIILEERRKSLVMRGLRWIDIKRLNVKGANISLRRNINSTALQLLPNDLKYAIAIPETVINFSGMPQNKR